MRAPIKDTSMTTSFKDTGDRCAFVHQRLIAAPREAVFNAMADPLRLARWWGPRGFSNRFDLFEPQEGGRWHFVMIGPDGQEYANQSVFTAFQKPERWAVEHVVAPHFHLSVELLAQDGHTLVRWRQVFDSPEVRESIAAIVGPANEDNLDRLSAEVAGLTPV
jgi:uncharacterized protein YndB with AHSA1/START domain